MSAKLQLIQASVVPLAFAALILAMTTCVDARQKAPASVRHAAQIAAMIGK